MKTFVVIKDSLGIKYAIELGSAVTQAAVKERALEFAKMVAIDDGERFAIGTVVATDSSSARLKHAATVPGGDGINWMDGTFTLGDN